MGSAQNPPVIEPGYTYASVTDKISAIVLRRGTPRGWYFGFAIAFALLMLLTYAVFWLFAIGVGIWGINIPVGWGFAIVNFVWWIGIGHAGTLISAILLLLRQRWRTSINRFAEAMTLFAVACAGLFPLLHMGRPWLAYWMAPYPNTMGLWPQFRSPLVWDVFAVSTYATVSLLFWFVGLIPDLATLRDRARKRAAKVIYGILAMGWRGSAVHWHRYELASLLLAGLATPLVVSVHTVVSFDFAVALVPGWHTTIFPPYFVAGAIYSGFAPELAARPVTVYEFTVTAVRPAGDFRDVDATIRCSSGTYIRALARDLGAALGTGGHLTALRRTAVGPYDLSQSHTLEFLSSGTAVTPLAETAAAAFPRVDLTEDDARRLGSWRPHPAVVPGLGAPRLGAAPVPGWPCRRRRPRPRPPPPAPPPPAPPQKYRWPHSPQTAH